MLLVDEGQYGTFVPDIRKIGILNRRMIVSCKRTRNLFDLTNIWKNTVIDNMPDDLPLSEAFPNNKREDDKREDLLNQMAFDNLFDPWPEPVEQDDQPVTSYEDYRRRLGRSISLDRQIEAQVWNRIYGRALPTSHGH